MYETLQHYRVLLAPLRFGAGLKGKLLDAMLTGTPNVTTTIGAEGMKGYADWPGSIEDDPQTFIESAIYLYQQEAAWNKASSLTVGLVDERFRRSIFKEPFLNKMMDLKRDLSAHRIKNFTGQMLSHHMLASTRYMGKWIEEKNKD